jgi:fermentation-respiration switch protein FrsA (DUF1100 family)
MPRLVATLLLALVISYLLLLVFVYFYQKHLLFLPDFPSRKVDATPKNVGLDYEDITLITTDRIRLHAWWVEHTTPRGTILFFHGNAGNLSHRLTTLQLFHDLGYSTLIVEYRGYGKSSGTPSEQGLYADADAAWQYLHKQRRLQPDDIIIAGRSLGAAIALYLAEKHPPRALIMESSFTSVPDMAAIHYPWLPVRWLTKYDFNNRVRIEQLHCPLLLVHSEQDEIAPYSQGKILYKLAPEPKEFLTLRGGHNDAQLTDYQQYMEGLRQFLGRY